MLSQSHAIMMKNTVQLFFVVVFLFFPFDAIPAATLRASTSTHQKNENESNNANLRGDHAKVFGATSTDRALGSSLNVKRIGNDGSPSSAFPLGMCQGDCDDDSDCEGDLVCFQRRAYQEVPGCDGGSDDGKPTDYCVQSTTLGTSGGTTSANLILQLYWEKGYYWQNDPNEIDWCLKCTGSKCDFNDFLVVVYCAIDNPTKLKFVDFGSEFMIQIGGTQTSDELCLELNTKSWNYEVKRCDTSDALQRFASGNGNHDGSGRFEMYPTTKSNFCLTQRHHPKYGEQLRAETCESARRSNTSFWIKY